MYLNLSPSLSIVSSRFGRTTFIELAVYFVNSLFVLYMLLSPALLYRSGFLFHRLHKKSYKVCFTVFETFSKPFFLI